MRRLGADPTCRRLGWSRGNCRVVHGHTPVDGLSGYCYHPDQSIIVYSPVGAGIAACIPPINRGRCTPDIAGPMRVDRFTVRGDPEGSFGDRLPGRCVPWSTIAIASSPRRSRTRECRGAHSLRAPALWPWLEPNSGPRHRTPARTSSSAARSGWRRTTTRRRSRWRSPPTTRFPTTPCSGWPINTSQANPDVEIEFILIPAGTDARVWTVTQLTGGNAPEIVWTQSFDTNRDVGKGWWTNLLPYMEQPNPYVDRRRSGQRALDRSVLRRANRRQVRAQWRNVCRSLRSGDHVLLLQQGRLRARRGREYRPPMPSSSTTSKLQEAGIARTTACSGRGRNSAKC